jgi:hypothetical protein
MWPLIDFRARFYLNIMMTHMKFYKIHALKLHGAWVYTKNIRFDVILGGKGIESVHIRLLVCFVFLLFRLTNALLCLLLKTVKAMILCIYITENWKQCGKLFIGFSSNLWNDLEKNWSIGKHCGLRDCDRHSLKLLFIPIEIVAHTYRG